MKTLLSLLLTILVFAMSCQNEEATQPEVTIDPVIENERVSITMTKAEEQIVAQNTDFAFNYFRAMEQAYPEKKQMALSPLSASIALSMLSNGAEGETLNELLNGLGFKDLNMEATNLFHKKLMGELSGLDRTSAVAFANSIWMNIGFNPLKTFTKSLTDNYNAEVRQLDFATAIPVINQWCEEKTNGCIKNFLSDLNPEAKAVLLNALYFKGNWKVPFLKENIRKGTFSNEDGSRQEADFMHLGSSFRYGKNEYASVLELPYGNEAFNLQIVLPNEGTEWKSCIAKLDGDSWRILQKGMSEKLIDLKLPKFKIEQKERLNEALNSLGIMKAFTLAEADFSNMTEEKLFIESVQQATYFNVDENGTEAAAVTGIMTETDPGSGEVQVKPIPFYVQRPFLFLLTEKSTGSILFMGKVTDMK